MTTEAATNFQMVTWHVTAPQQKSFSPPLLEADAERTLATVKKQTGMDGFIQPFPDAAG
jgi:hypothetical protein